MCYFIFLLHNYSILHSKKEININNKYYVIKIFNSNNLLKSNKLIKTIPIKQEFVKNFNRIPPCERDTDSIFCNHLVLQLYCQNLLKVSKKNSSLKFQQFSFTTYQFLNNNQNEKWGTKVILNLTETYSEDSSDEEKNEISQSEQLLYEWNLTDEYIKELKKNKIHEITSWVELSSKNQQEINNRLNFLIPQYSIQNEIFAMSIKQFNFASVDF